MAVAPDSSLTKHEKMANTLFSSLVSLGGSGLELVADDREGIGQLRTNGGNCCYNHHRYQASNQAVLDGGSAGVVVGET